jgi:hypothetical protein
LGKSLLQEGQAILFTCCRNWTIPPLPCPKFPYRFDVLHFLSLHLPSGACAKRPSRMKWSTSKLAKSRSKPSPATWLTIRPVGFHALEDFEGGLMVSVQFDSNGRLGRRRFGVFLLACLGCWGCPSRFNGSGRELLDVFLGVHLRYAVNGKQELPELVRRK